MDKTLSWPYFRLFFLSSHPNALKNTENRPLRAETLTNSLSTGALAKIENATIHLDKSKWKNTC
tara:strand:+ start:399 stop:590 length:192 start_codon:yes stop_codon:yes gene_type:complete